MDPFFLVRDKPLLSVDPSSDRTIDAGIDWISDETSSLIHESFAYQIYEKGELRLEHDFCGISLTPTNYLRTKRISVANSISAGGRGERGNLSVKHGVEVS